MQSRIKILVMVIGLREAQFKELNLAKFEIWNYEPDYSELYDTKSFYQLIESIKEYENLKTGIFI